MVEEAEQFKLEKVCLDLQNFLMLGIMLCPGTKQEKSKVYYRLIQEAMQEEIDSYDSELDKTIKSALTFATITIPRI